MKELFCKFNPSIDIPLVEACRHLWKKQLQRSPQRRLPIKPPEFMAPGHQTPWKNWRCLNRLRTGVVRTKSTLAKWGFHSGPLNANEEVQKIQLNIY